MSLEKPPQTRLEKEAAALRDRAGQAIRLSYSLSDDVDRARLEHYAHDLRAQATELERRAAVETPRRTDEPRRDAAQDERKPKKGRGGSNEPEPQS